MLRTLYAGPQQERERWVLSWAGLINFASNLLDIHDPTYAARYSPARIHPLLAVGCRFLAAYNETVFVWSPLNRFTAKSPVDAVWILITLRKLRTCTGTVAVAGVAEARSQQEQAKEVPSNHPGHCT